MVRRLLSLALVLALANNVRPAEVPGAPAGANNQPPAEAFFEPAGVMEPRLSPDGSKICVLTRFDPIHYELTLIELPTLKMTQLARPPRMTVANFCWKNDDLLLFVARTDDGVVQPYSLELHNGKLHELTDIGVHGSLELVNLLPEEPEQMLFQAQRMNSHQNDLIRINVRTGEEKVAERDPGPATVWFNRTDGTALAAVGFGPIDPAVVLLWRQDASHPWQSRKVAGPGQPPFLPFGTAPDGRRLIATDYNQSSTGRVRYYDPVSGRLEEEIEPPHEVEPGYVVPWGFRSEPGAIVYSAERNTYRFLNQEMARDCARLEKLLPGTDWTFPSFTRDNRLATVAAYNDRNPGVFCLVNFETGKITVLGLVSRALNPARMAPGRAFKFATRDGLTVTGRITLPAGLTKPPLIVQIGPGLTNPTEPNSFYARDQYFASRGYAVARFNYRGTPGHGRDIAQAGDFQIEGMARDVTEGVDWLAAQGWIDGGRVAVLGEGRGGIVAFQLAAHGRPFKALVNFDSEIDTDDDSAFSFAPGQRTNDGARAVIGGRLAAEAYAARWSPLKAVPQLAVPSFHHYTSNPLGSHTDDADKLNNALKKFKKDGVFTTSLTDFLLIKENTVPWREAAKNFEAAVAFLDQKLGPAEPAK